MAKKAPPPAPAADGDAPPKKSKLKLIIIAVVAALLLIGTSVGVTVFLLGGKSSDADSAEHAESAAAAPVKAQAIYEELTPAFVVNFNYQGRQRFMQVSVALMGRNKADMDALKAQMPVIRNRLVMLFSGQDFDGLMKPLGKDMLRQQATAAVQEIAQKEVGKPVVEQVLFTNFVLQ
ncbi:flagellar basal body-associated protein FliL [Pseudomonas sp. Marseille-QA0892]